MRIRAASGVRKGPSQCADMIGVSLQHKQVTCACCGKAIRDRENINVEPLVDPSVRYVVTHWDCTTFPRRLTVTMVVTDTAIAQD